MHAPPTYRMKTAFSCRGVPFFPSSMQGEQAWMKKSGPISWTTYHALQGNRVSHTRARRSRPEKGEVITLDARSCTRNHKQDFNQFFQDPMGYYGPICWAGCTKDMASQVETRRPVWYWYVIGMCTWYGALSARFRTCCLHVRQVRPVRLFGPLWIPAANSAKRDLQCSRTVLHQLGKSLQSWNGMKYTSEGPVTMQPRITHGNPDRFNGLNNVWNITPTSCNYRVQPARTEHGQWIRDRARRFLGVFSKSEKALAKI